MVLDFCQGCSWTPAVITGVLGPLTYLVKTQERFKSLAKPVADSDEQEDTEVFREVVEPCSPPSELSEEKMK